MFISSYYFFLFLPDADGQPRARLFAAARARERVRRYSVHVCTLEVLATPVFFPPDVCVVSRLS